MQERGLKLATLYQAYGDIGVAPYAGAWIEMWLEEEQCTWEYGVAPYAGAWIEILL